MTDSAEGEAGRTEDNRSSSILDTSSSESSETWSNKGAGGTCEVLTSGIETGTGIVLVSSLVSSESSMSIGTDSGEVALQASGGGPVSIGGVGGGGDCGASADGG